MQCRRPDYLVFNTTRATKKINVCHEFAYEHVVIFNPKKTVCMLFVCKIIANGSDMHLGGEKFRWEDLIRLLFNSITPDLQDDLKIHLKDVIY